jgi:glycosyltransferase involved in cell wall biosynthesis
MDQQENRKRITAVIPAYNEASRIGPVLEVIASHPHIDEVIVVDDGSSDRTEDVVRAFHVRYVKNAENRGKGYSMDRGVSLAKHEVIFFCDADVIGLSRGIVDEIIGPVASGRIGMFIGMRNRKWYCAHQIVSFIPLLGGERALTRTLWQKIPAYYKHCFRIESALNFYAIYYGDGFQYKIFRGLSQVIKEKKYGFRNGTRQRWRMFYHIFSAQLKLQFVHIPESSRNSRILSLLSLQSLIGMIFGGLFLAAVYFGPDNFINALFGRELSDGSHAPVAQFLWNFANATAASTIALMGILILIPNAFIFLLTFKKLGFLLYGLNYKIRNNKS